MHIIQFGDVSQGSRSVRSLSLGDYPGPGIINIVAVLSCKHRRSEPKLCIPFHSIHQLRFSFEYITISSRNVPLLLLLVQKPTILDQSFLFTPSLNSNMLSSVCSSENLIHGVVRGQNVSNLVNLSSARIFDEMIFSYYLQHRIKNKSHVEKLDLWI